MHLPLEKQVNLLKYSEVTKFIMIGGGEVIKCNLYWGKVKREDQH